MKAVPSKAREPLIFGAAMAVTALAWLVAGNAHIAALGFLAIGAGMVGHALYRWTKPPA